MTTIRVHIPGSHMEHEVELVGKCRPGRPPRYCKSWGTWDPPESPEIEDVQGFLVHGKRRRKISESMLDKVLDAHPTWDDEMLERAAEDGRGE